MKIQRILTATAMALGIGLVCLAAVDFAHAGELLQLPLPTQVIKGNQPNRTSCVGASFAADHSILGACHTVSSQACSGRGCNPAQTTTVWIATWDAAGNALSGVGCSQTRHHVPQPNVTTYLGGHTAADCPDVDLNPTGTTVTVDGVPFYYIAADAVTGAQLLASNTWGFLATP